MKKYLKSKKDMLKMTVICMSMIALLAAIIYLLLMTIKGDISKIELPIVAVANGFGKMYGLFYGVIILSAIITTAISSAYGFLNNMAKNEREYQIYNRLLCLGSLFVCFFGFSNLVASVYPAFGILGMIQLCLIFFYRK